MRSVERSQANVNGRLAPDTRPAQALWPALVRLTLSRPFLAAPMGHGRAVILRSEASVAGPDTLAPIAVEP